MKKCYYLESLKVRRITKRVLFPNACPFLDIMTQRNFVNRALVYFKYSKVKTFRQFINNKLFSYIYK